MHPKRGLLHVVRFCIAGAVGVAAYYTALYCLTEYFGLWYIFSAAVGFVLNTGINFVLQKYWTFKNADHRFMKRQIVLYVSTNIAILISNAILLYVLVQHAHMWYMAAQMILTILFAIISFKVVGNIFKNET